MHKNKISILFICPYPVGQSPSQRFRFEQYFGLLQTKGFAISIHSFLSDSVWQILYKKGHFVRKAIGVLSGFVRRLFLLLSVMHFDFIFIHREATPVGPPWFEWIVAKVFRKKIIYDFDDAIWLSNTSEENSLISRIKCYSKVKAICKWSHAVSCGNEYLIDFAKLYNNHVFMNPTTIETEKLHNPELFSDTRESDKITIGWTGTHSTLKYLDSLVPVIQLLEQKFLNQMKFVVIADKKPAFDLSTLHFVLWKKETEIIDLLQFDIGVMPLTDDVWAKGKCGFKALQYMALGIPAVASPVGVNSIIVDQGVNGFLCKSSQQWEEALTKLMNDAAFRKQMGEKGRKKIIDHYSVSSNSSNFLSLFE